MLARVYNKAPLSIATIQLYIEYPDSSGSLRQTTRRLQVLIPPGESYTTDLSIGTYANASFLKTIRIRVTDAQLVE